MMEDEMRENFQNELSRDMMGYPYDCYLNSLIYYRSQN